MPYFKVNAFFVKTSEPYPMVLLACNEEVARIEAQIIAICVLEGYTLTGSPHVLRAAVEKARMSNLMWDHEPLKHVQRAELAFTSIERLNDSAEMDQAIVTRAEAFQRVLSRLYAYAGPRPVDDTAASYADPPKDLLPPFTKADVKILTETELPKESTMSTSSSTTDVLPKWVAAVGLILLLAGLLLGGLGAFLFSTPQQRYQFTHDGGVVTPVVERISQDVKFDEIIDATTFRVRASIADDLFYAPLIRLDRINTPPADSTSTAKLVTAAVEVLLTKAKRLAMTAVGKDPAGKTVAQITLYTASGEALDLGEVLIRSGVAKLSFEAGGDEDVWSDARLLRARTAAEEIIRTNGTSAVEGALR